MALLSIPLLPFLHSAMGCMHHSTMLNLKLALSVLPIAFWKEEFHEIPHFLNGQASTMSSMGCTMLEHDVCSLECWKVEVGNVSLCNTLSCIQDFTQKPFFCTYIVAILLVYFKICIPLFSQSSSQNNKFAVLKFKERASLK